MLDPVEQLQSVHLGHHDVEHQEVGVFLFEESHQILAAGGGDHVIPLAPQDVLQGVQQRLIVVGDDDLGRGRHPAVLPRVEMRAGSIFPPLTTNTIGPGAVRRPERRAAVVAAPEGSTVSFCTK